MGAGNKGKHFNKDRKEFNNDTKKALKAPGGSNLLGIDIFIQALIILIAGAFYSFYRLYKYNKQNNNDIDLDKIKNDIMSKNPNIKKIEIVIE